MLCPRCGATKVLLRTIDSRVVPITRAIRRRRQCETCGYRFTTMEHVTRTDRESRLRSSEPDWLLRRAMTYLVRVRRMLKQGKAPGVPESTGPADPTSGGTDAPTQ